MVDFTKPQPFNVEIGEPEVADTFGHRAMPVPEPLFEPPPVVLIEQDADLYPPIRHGVLPQRTGRFRR